MKLRLDRVLPFLTLTTLLGGCGGYSAGQSTPGGYVGWNAAPSGVLNFSDRRSSAGFIYVANIVTQSPNVGDVLVYPVGSNGNVTPSTVISGSKTLLTLVNGIVVDQSGEIFVADSDVNMIVGFAPGSAGNISPNVIITGPKTGLVAPHSLAIDATGDLYVSNCGTDCGFGPTGPPSIEEFSAGSNGNAAPIRVIAGSRPGFGGSIKGITLDPNGAVTIAAWDSNAALTFGPRKNGNVYAKRAIAGSQTEISSPNGIAASKYGLYVANAGAGRITRYGPRANGNAPLARSPVSG
jgi:energy-coupling factor transporter ATP-binding protein EcfA2